MPEQKDKPEKASGNDLTKPSEGVKVRFDGEPTRAIEEASIFDKLLGFSIGKPRIPEAIITSFLSQLVMLLEAGVTLLRAINTLADHDELIAPIAALEPDIGFLTVHPTEGEFPFFDAGVLLAQKLGLETAVPSHYACFVKRTFDPQEWASLFPDGGPRPMIIPWNSHIVYPVRG